MIEGLMRALSKVPHLGALLRSWRGRFILVVVATQLLLPLHYYVARYDYNDERFAWRMFSPIRMTSCRPEATLDGKPLALGHEFHEFWIEAARRGRLGVVEAMGHKLCHKHPGAAVAITLRCTYLDREEPVLFGGFNLCDAPRI